jgi:hypothetical protein
MKTDLEIKQELANRVIDSLGGTGAVARLCDVIDPVVSQWRNRGFPKPWEKFLRRARPKAFK